MKISMGKIKLSFNSPVVLGFTFLCLAVLFLDWLTNSWTTRNLFCVYNSSLVNPLTYVRFFGHVLGHANWDHFIGNIMLLLIVGPLLEEKYGSLNILFVIVSTALVTGLVHFFLFPNTALLGASGVVFAFILLSPFTSVKEGTIPLTVILVAIIYIGEQVYNLTNPDEPDETKAKEVYIYKFDAIVDVDIYNKVQIKLSANRTSESKKQNKQQNHKCLIMVNF